MLDKNSRLPLYYQVKEDIIENIKNNIYKVEESIPTENELQSHYQVSRSVIRQAIGELITEGYLYRKRGIGTFVSNKYTTPSFNDYFSALNTDDLIKLNGKTITKKIVDYKKIKAGSDICELFKLPVGSDFYIFYRVEYGNEEPITLTRTYLPSIYASNFEKDITQIEISFHSYLEQQGYPIDTLDANIEILDSYDTMILSILKLQEGTPVLFLNSKNSTINGTLIEYSSTAINYRNVHIPIKRKKQ